MSYKEYLMMTYSTILSLTAWFSKLVPVLADVMLTLIIINSQSWVWQVVQFSKQVTIIMCIKSPGFNAHYFDCHVRLLPFDYPCNKMWSSLQFLTEFNSPDWLRDWLRAQSSHLDSRHISSYTSRRRYIDVKIWRKLDFWRHFSQSSLFHHH